MSARERTPRSRAPFSVRAGYAAAAGIVRPSMRLLTRQQWLHTERLPKTGAIVVSNHISEFDPLDLAHMVYNQGLVPTFLAKAELWRVAALRPILEGLRQIPVERGGDAARSLDTAREVLAEGGVIIVYPEGTVTRDPEGWPMTGRSGAVRLALQTGVPLVPVGQWGTHDVLPYKGRPSLVPRKRIRIAVGEPVDLSDLRGRKPSRDDLKAGTDRMMDAITALVAELRGEQPPAGRWDMRTGRREGSA
jgi:1-acyl-sn-glycerol-3-phosphate acyltransferase